MFVYKQKGVRIQTNACSYTNNCGSLHGRNLPKIKKIYVFVYEQNVGCIRGFLFVYEQKYDRIQTKKLFVYRQCCSYTNEFAFVYKRINVCIRENLLLYKRAYT